MKTNMGTNDRIMRIALGVVLTALPFAFTGSAYAIWGLVGIVPLLTGLVGWCPLYALVGFSSCQRVQF